MTLKVPTVGDLLAELGKTDGHWAAFDRTVLAGCQCDFAGRLEPECSRTGDCRDLCDAFEEINNYAEGKTK